MDKEENYGAHLLRRHFQVTEQRLALDAFLFARTVVVLREMVASGKLVLSDPSKPQA